LSGYLSHPSKSSPDHDTEGTGSAVQSIGIRSHPAQQKRKKKERKGHPPEKNNPDLEFLPHLIEASITSASHAKTQEIGQSGPRVDLKCEKAKNKKVKKMRDHGEKQKLPHQFA
jgi:hypothetical protein